MSKRLIGSMIMALLVAGCGLLPGVGTTSAPAPASSAQPTLAIGVTPQAGGEQPTLPAGATPGEGQAVEAPPATGPVVEGYDPFATARPVAAVEYAMPPTVQHVTDTTAQIMFELEAGQPGFAFYRLAGDPSSPVRYLPLDPSNTRHVLTLESLSPSSEYEFIVRIGEGTFENLLDVAMVGSHWGSQSFRTKPYDSPLRFAVIGDSGFAEPVTFALVEAMAEYDPAFVLHVGDIVYDSQDDPDPYWSYQFKYFGPFSTVLHRMPVYPAVGNHDVTDRDIILWDRPAYYWAFPPISDPVFPDSAFEERRKWYAFEAGGVQFISLDTQVMFGEPGREEQLAWLEERLADTRFSYTIAFFHVPPYTSGPHYEESAPVRPIGRMLEAAGVPVVFSGHDHDYERLTSGPTTYFVTGGGSAVLYTFTEEHAKSEFFAPRSHFLLVEIDSDSIDVHAIAADGDVIDEVSLPAPP